MENSTVDFNEIKTIKLINKTDLLKQVFNSDDEIDDYNQMSLLAKAKNGTLDDNVTDSLTEIFDIIKNRETYLSDYTSIVVKEKHPRRYGKRQIERDIENQGGVATENQLTMLAVNSLKNMFLTLQNKGVADQYRNAGKISVAHGKLIRSAIRSLANQLEPVLSPKK